MGRVDVAFHGLDEVAVLDVADVLPVVLRHLHPLELRELGHLVWRPHVRPDDPGGLLGGVGSGPHFVLEVGLRRLGGHVHTAAFYVPLPAVVDAAQAVLLVAAVEQRRAPVRAQRFE